MIGGGRPDRDRPADRPDLGRRRRQQRADGPAEAARRPDDRREARRQRTRPALIKAVRKGQVGGVIAFDKRRAEAEGGRPAATAGGERRQQPAAAGDDRPGGRRREAAQEGPPDISPAELGKSGDEGQAQGSGAEDGLLPEGPRRQRRPRAGPRRRPAEHRDSIKSRTFGSDPDAVARSGSPLRRGSRTAGRSPRPSTSPASAAPPSTPTTRGHDRRDQRPAAERPVAVQGRGRRRRRDDDGLHRELSDARGEEAGGVLARDRQGPAARPARLRRRRDHRRPRGSLGDRRARRRWWRPPAALEAGDDLLLYAKSTNASDEGLRPLVRR